MKQLYAVLLIVVMVNIVVVLKNSGMVPRPPVGVPRYHEMPTNNEIGPLQSQIITMLQRLDSEGDRRDVGDATSVLLGRKMTPSLVKVSDHSSSVRSQPINFADIYSAY